MQIQATHVTKLTVELPASLDGSTYNLVSRELLAIEAVKEVSYGNMGGTKLDVEICTGVGSNEVTDAGLAVQDAIRSALGIPGEAVMAAHEFCTLYNDDRRGRCANEGCEHKNECVLCRYGQSCPLSRKFVPVVTVKVNINGVMWLNCQSHGGFELTEKDNPDG